LIDKERIDGGYAICPVCKDKLTKKIENMGKN